MDLIMRMVWVRRSEGSVPAEERLGAVGEVDGWSLPLKARDLRRPSMYMLNSFKFSGSTSWPGGWEPEKLFR